MAIRLPRLSAAVAAALLALAGCGDGNQGDDSSSEPTAAKPSGGGGGDEVKVYFTTGEQFNPVQRDRSEAGGPEPAVKELLQGPTPGEQDGDVPAETQIPEGTELEGVDVAADGTAVVKVSPRFLAGIPSDPDQRSTNQRAELNARVAQVAYTATQFDKVRSAKVVSGGVPVEPGTSPDAKVTRTDYAAPPGGPPQIVKPRGAKLPGTRQVQTRLAKLGYLPKRAIDGLAGYQTQMAVIAFQAWNGLERDGVVGPATSAALETGRRPKPRAGGPARRIEVYRDLGVALLIDAGRTKRAIHVSSGGPGTETPSGRFQVFRKELRSWSVPFQTWLPYASYFNQGIAFHEYPDVPAFPASHGCVRVPAPEAKGVYDFATIGTTVIVV